MICSTPWRHLYTIQLCAALPPVKLRSPLCSLCSYFDVVVTAQPVARTGLTLAAASYIKLCICIKRNASIHNIPVDDGGGGPDGGLLSCASSAHRALVYPVAMPGRPDLSTSRRADLTSKLDDIVRQSRGLLSPQPAQGHLSTA